MHKIPKIIHYCWFGGNPLPELAQHCIKSWKTMCPDYEVMVWNEENIDISSNLYMKQAYEQKKWAFVSDYARVYALYHYGGIYLDTDIEIKKSLEKFLGHAVLLGLETENRISTAIIGAEKENTFIKEVLEHYESRVFVKENGELDVTTNVEVITKLLEKLGFTFGENKQYNLKEITIYPREYFSPKDFETGVIKETENTHTIHYFDASWWSEEHKKDYFRKKRLVKIFGNYLGVRIHKRMKQYEDKRKR